MKPHFKKLICDSETPVSLYTKLALAHGYAFLFESAETHERIGRYSIIGFDTEEKLVFETGLNQNPLQILKESFEEIKFEASSELPRIQAPFVGFFNYEVVRHFEKLNLPLPKADTPESIFFLPKFLIIFDHFEHTIIAIAYSEQNLKKLLENIEHAKNIPGPLSIDLDAVAKNPLQTPETDEGFEKLVRKAKEDIVAGEIFQIVLSQEFKKETRATPFDLYRRLRLISPSPYMFHLQFPQFSIIGSSPETLVRTEDEEIIIRPIAGTRRRGKNPQEDKELAEELKNDTKEQAEHMMLVDLGRHDVGRVAEEGSVRVTKQMEVENFSHVMHFVSEIRGKKRSGTTLFDIFQAAFPAGTLTGAPKIRAMEMIAKFEGKPRGIYGGAVGYFDLSGNMDFAIAIRTMMYQNSEVTLRAGAGIVYDSEPRLENKECHNKARAPLSSLSL